MEHLVPQDPQEKTAEMDDKDQKGREGIWDSKAKLVKREFLDLRDLKGHRGSEASKDHG